MANWTQTFPDTGAGTDGTVCDTAGYAHEGYGIIITSGDDDSGNDFGNHQTPLFTPPDCKEDPNRTFLLTRTVDPNAQVPGGGTGAPGSPINYPTVANSAVFTDPPLYDFQVNFKDNGSGETSATISCSPSGTPDSTTPASGWDTSNTYTNRHVYGDITCTITVDP